MIFSGCTVPAFHEVNQVRVDLVGGGGGDGSVAFARSLEYLIAVGIGDGLDDIEVGRALAQLGIEHIAAYSPQARGRSERAFRTLQDRLPKELRLAGVTTVEAANRFLADTFIADYNARFAVTPEQRGSAFVAVACEQWRDVLCIQEERIVGNDNTVRFNRRVLQIPPSPLRPHYVRAKVRVHHYPDGTYAIFLGPRAIARYSVDASLRDDDNQTRQAA